MRSGPNHTELGVTLICPAGLSVEMELQGLIAQVMFKADLELEHLPPHETIQNKKTLINKKQTDFLKESSDFFCLYSLNTFSLSTKLT